MPSLGVKPLSATPCGEIGKEQRIAELSAAHQRAYEADRHAEVVRLTTRLNATRGLTPKRSVDLRDDTQRDRDEERDHGWACER
jgi:hypothetical protein